MRSRLTAVAVLLAAIPATCLWLVPNSGASATTVVAQCGQGRPATYKLKDSDAAFVKQYLNCVLSADGLHAHPKDTIALIGKSYVSSGPGGAVGGYTTIPTNFPKYMAPTIAGFVKASKSDYNFKYINAKLEDAYQKTNDGPIPGFYEYFQGTAPPSPTLAQVAAAFAPARSTIDQSYPHHRLPPLVTDVVVQRGASWFHDAPGVHLRILVLIKAVA